MKKSEFILSFVGHLLDAKNQQLSMDKIKEFYPKARSSFFRNISEITNFMMPSGEPLFVKFEEGEKSYIKVNNKFTIKFIPDGEKNIFDLQNLMKVGSLLDHSLIKEVLKELKDIYQINGKSKVLNQKFYHHSRLETHHDLDIYREIVSALLGNNIVNFTYNDKEYFDYKLLSLCQYRDAIYLNAYTGEFHLAGVKTFKLVRFESFEITQGKFTYPSCWDVEKYYQNRDLVDEKRSHAVFRVFRESRKQIREKTFFNKIEVSSNDLYDEYRVSYSNSHELLGQLFVYAQDIEIIEDDELKEAFLEKAQKAIEQNLVS